MFIKDLVFKVEFSAYAEAHFCKDFGKKYKGRQWIETRRTITETLERAFAVSGTSLIDPLKFFAEDDIGIFKLDFRVAGSNESPKTSGNRAIFSLSNRTGEIVVLLVYGKGHVGKRLPETQWIFEHVKGAFPEFRMYS